jgi:hypothetical protein
MAPKLFDFESPPPGMNPFTALVDDVEISYDVFVGGEGPAVILMHEIDGMGGPVKSLAEHLAHQGFTVYLPHFFSSMRQGVIACIRKEFLAWQLGATDPITRWLGELGSEANRRDVQGRMVGIIGMCFSGGFALATLVTGLPVTAAVAAQPSLPWAGPAILFSQRRKRDLGLSPGDRSTLEEKLVGGRAKALPLRFEADWKCPQLRVEEISGMEGADAVRYLEGKGHSTLTQQFRQEGGHAGSLQAIDSVVEWLKDALARRSVD